LYSAIFRLKGGSYLSVVTEVTKATDLKNGATEKTAASEKIKN